MNGSQGLQTTDGPWKSSRWVVDWFLTVINVFTGNNYAI